MYKINISIYETLVNINLVQSQTESRRYYFVCIALHVYKCCDLHVHVPFPQVLQMQAVLPHES